MKKLFLIICLSFIGLCLAVPSSQASLIGSSFFLSHRSPDSSTNIESYLVNVVDGTDDQLNFGLAYISNPESDRILVDFFRPFDFEPTPFNGHAGDFISDPIQNIAVDTNMQGWDQSRLTYSKDSFRFNWAGLSVDENTYFTAKLNFQTSSPGEGGASATPEPATILLFGAGAGAFIFSSFRRKFSK